MSRFMSRRVCLNEMSIGISRVSVLVTFLVVTKTYGMGNLRHEKLIWFSFRGYSQFIVISKTWLLDGLGL